MYTPKKLTWNDRLSTGDAEIDEQHRFLINTFNDLGAAIQHGHGTESVNRILGVLGHYAAFHFSKEEDCMTRHRCIASEINRKAHAIFVEKFTTYRKEYDLGGGSNELAMRIHHELSDWIVAHILSVDTQLYPCIRNKTKPGSSAYR